MLWLVVSPVPPRINPSFGVSRLAGFEYSERSVLGVNAASKWHQELAELGLAARAKPFYLGYKDSGLLGISCIASDNNLDNFMWYTLNNLVGVIPFLYFRSFGTMASHWVLFNVLRVNRA